MIVSRPEACANAPYLSALAARSCSASAKVWTVLDRSATPDGPSKVTLAGKAMAEALG